WVRKLILAVAAFDAAETVGMLVLGILRCPDRDCVPDAGIVAVGVFTSLKWAGVLLLLVLGVIAVVQKWTEVRRFGRLLRIQRFSLLAFLPIAALATVP